MNPAPVPSTPESESAPELANGVKRWRVGTLTYGTAGLIVLFCWLLWGDFAWNMKERAVQPMSQLLFKQFKASDLVLGLMVTSLPAALGMLIGPIVSVRSDNHRGRWGRRIPYLLIPTPIAALAMVGMGYTVEIADLLHGVLGADAPDPIACRLIVFAGLWTFFEIFTVIANSVFVGLINDVVPQAVIGRFFALFRIVGLGAGIVFNSFLIGHAEENFKLLFIGLGLLYGLGFSVMCFMVKEGEYPPPAPKTDGAFTSRVAEPIKAYVRECSAHRFYIWIFLAAMIGNAAFLPINSFDVPYIRSIGMSMERYGELRSITYAISICLALFIGWFADKYHPIRVGICALVVYAAIALWAGFFATDIASFSVAYVAHGVISGIFFTGTASLFPRLFPRAKFAQFASAAGIILAVGFIGVPPVVGRLLDLTDHAYHYTFVIGGGLAATGALAFFILYRQFVALGGSERYAPPS
jgi:MFS family permease